MLKEYRAALDAIDDRIIAAFSERMDLVDAIGAWKKTQHLDAFDPDREAQMLDRLCAKVPENRKDAVKALYAAILAISKAQQRFQNTNIVLIGMPGSGKTSVARHLSVLLDRPIASTDEEAERRIGGTTESLFRTQGEAAFRAIETEVVRDLSSVWGSVIATGGGTVLSEDNRRILRENSRIYYIKRPLDELDTAGRPLSQGEGALARLYEQRRGIYEGFSDVQIEADSDFSLTAQRIAEEFQSFFHVHIQKERRD